MFKLNQPVSEFNHTASMKIFSPTPVAKDTKAQYGNRPFSSGRYKIESYTRDFSGVQPQNLGKLNQANVKTRVIEGPGTCRRYIAFNQQTPFLSDQKFREALVYGLDKKAYITARGGERLNAIVNSIVPESLDGYRESKAFQAAPEGDVTKAKELISQCYDWSSLSTIGPTSRTSG